MAFRLSIDQGWRQGRLGRGEGQFPGKPNRGTGNIDATGYNRHP